MISEALQQIIASTLTDNLETEIEIRNISSVGGGSINRAGVLDTNEGRFFVKWNDAHAYPDMFQLEMDGLALLREADAVYVPKTYGTGDDGQEAFLVMELVESGRREKDFYADYGQRLANLHRITVEQHGLDYNNYIGSLPQQNDRYDSWSVFFIEQRMEPMVAMARDSGLLTSEVVAKFERMYARLNDIFPDEPASLMHGDLWGGNHMPGPNGTVCLFDPAVYYGNREMEIAFTQVFSGYPTSFYEAYEDQWPLQPGFEKRKGFYQLWPLMVHVNLFGTSYLSPVKRILQVF